MRCRLQEQLQQRGQSFRAYTPEHQQSCYAGTKLEVLHSLDRELLFSADQANHDGCGHCATSVVWALQFFGLQDHAAAAIAKAGTATVFAWKGETLAEFFCILSQIFSPFEIRQLVALRPGVSRRASLSGALKVKGGVLKNHTTGMSEIEP